MSRIELDEENLEVLDDYELSLIIIELCDTVSWLFRSFNHSFIPSYIQSSIRFLFLVYI